jgi:hypothetical protein
MVKVTFRHWEEVVIHEDIEYDLDDLIKNRIIGLREGSITIPLVWAEGVVISRNVLPPTDDVIREQLKGIVHFSAVEWALMPKYRSTLKSEGITIPIIDASETETLREVAKELRKKHRNRQRARSNQ